MFDKLTAQQKRLAENLSFERAMISLADDVPCDLETLTQAFKKFAASRPQTWRDTALYCETHLLEHGRLPFDL